MKSKCKEGDMGYLLLDSFFDSVLGEITCHNWYKDKMKKCDTFQKKTARKHTRNIERNRFKYMLKAKQGVEGVVMKKLQRRLKN